MAGSGWQFSVTIPSWTQATLEGDENIVLKEELGNSKMAKLDPPSKNRLVGVNKRPDLVEKRRRDLESWLWKLIGDGEIARSRVLNNFLELSDAARLVQRQHAGQQATADFVIIKGLLYRVPPSAVTSRAASQTGSYAWSEGGSSSVNEGASQQSGAAPSTSDMYSTGVDGLPSLQPSQQPTQHSDSTPQLPGPQGPPSDIPQPMVRSASTSTGTSAASAPRTHQHTDIAPPPMSRTASVASDNPSYAQTSTAARSLPEPSNFLTQSAEPRMRLGLRVEQRVSVKQHMKALQQQLDRAAGDLQDAMEAIQTERHTKRQLAAQLADLQDRATENGVMQAVEREAELTTSLQKAHESSSQLQQQVTDLQAQLTAVQSQLQDSKSAYTQSQQQLSNNEEAVVKLQTQLEQLEAELTQSQQATSAAVTAHQDSARAASAATAGMSQQLSDSQQHVSSLQSRLEQVQTQLLQSQQAASQAESTYKDSQAATAANAEQQLAAGQQQVTQLLSELETVRQQLLQSKRAVPPEAEQPSREPGATASLAASAVDVSTDAPTVAPPATASSDAPARATASGLQPAESMTKLQAGKAAADARLAALMAELQALKQATADAEAKSRADRKVLAREVKALRKQLETEKQQAAAREAEHTAQEAEHAAREAERAARETEHAAREADQAAALQAEQAARADGQAAREDDPTSVEAQLATVTEAGPAITDAAKPEAPQEAEAAADVTARPLVDEAPEQETAAESEHASTSAAADGDLPPVSVSDTAAPVLTLAQTSYKQLLQEVAALRQRLHDSSFEVVAGQSAAGYDIKPQAAMEMLSTCDGRLQALMAEANLLGEAALSEGQYLSEDVELRQAFASTLIESGALRQQINALLRDKYEAEAHSRDVHNQQVTAPDMKGLFRKLPGMPFMAPHSNGAMNADGEAAKSTFGQGIGGFAGFGDRFSKSFSRPQ
ncbi:hypothetical protein ABBQ38_014399 [Trebouxia sp. C0009 RCD-2024]